MVTATFNKHDLLYAIEGFARGSHLRQHIWEKVFIEFIPQMNEEEIFFVWYYCMRDLFECYFGWWEYPSCGAEDFIHCMAALDLRNRVMVKTRFEGKDEDVLCYKFHGNYCPIKKSFNAYVAEQYIVSVSDVPFDPYVHQFGNDAKPWHKDINIYGMTDKEIHKLYSKNNK